jgi:hypothetical protein
MSAALESFACSSRHSGRTRTGSLFLALIGQPSWLNLLIDTLELRSRGW